MGLLLREASTIAGRRAGKSDRYFGALASSGGFAKLLQKLLPGRIHSQSIMEIENHDD